MDEFREEESVQTIPTWVSQLSGLIEGDRTTDLHLEGNQVFGVHDRSVRHILDLRNHSANVQQVLSDINASRKLEPAIPSAEIIDLLRGLIVAGHLSQQFRRHHGLEDYLQEKLSVSDKARTIIQEVLIGIHDTLESDATGSRRERKIPVMLIGQNFSRILKSKLPRHSIKPPGRRIILQTILQNNSLLNLNQWREKKLVP